MTKNEWKKQILGIIAAKLCDMEVSAPSGSEFPSDADEARINQAKQELMDEFSRRAGS